MEPVDLKYDRGCVPPDRDLARPINAVTGPPALSIMPWFAPSSFEREDASRFTRLTLEGELRRGMRAPRRIELVTDRGGKTHSYEASEVSTERRGRRRRRSAVRVTLTFEVPPALVEDRNVEFRLFARRRGEIELPFPTLAPVSASAVPRLRAGVVAAALGATVLLAAPGGAMADGQSTTTTTTQTTTTTPAETTTTGSTDTTTGSTSGDGTTTGSTSGDGTTTGSTSGDGTSTGSTSGDGDTSTTGDGTTTTGSGSGNAGTGSTTTTTGTGTTTVGSGSGSSGSGSTGTGTGTTTTTTPTGTTTTSTGGKSGKPGKSGKSGKASGAALSSALSALSASSSVTGKVKKTAGLKSADGNAPAPTVLAPAPLPAVDYGAYSAMSLTGGVSLANMWGSGMFADPFTELQLLRFAAEAQHMTRPPKYLVRDYEEAARRYHLPWEVLAAINYIETGYGRDLAVSSAGAVGWMQFMPSTWAEYGEAVTTRGEILREQVGDPWLPRDAIFSAARLLVADGAHNSLAKAVYGYNHAQWYVQEVLTLAQRIATKQLGKHPKPKQRAQVMLTMAKLLNGVQYVWGGGHTTSDWIVQTGYDCSGFVSAVLHAGGYLSFPQTTQTLPYQPRIVQGPGRWVTIFDRTDAGVGEDHVIIDIDGQFWEEGGGGPSGAAMVHRMHDISGAYLRSFNLVLHPKGL